MFGRTIVRQTPEGMAKEVARIIQKKIIENNDKGIPTVLGLATGSTPIPVYKELRRMHQEEGLDFSSVITFNLDEYWGLEKTHVQSYHYYMHQYFFDHVNIKKENIHILEGMIPLEEIKEHVAQFEEEIKKAGGIDIQILGLGVNGHIGFNEPGSKLDSQTRLIELDDKTREANKRFFDTKDEVPTHALTMGIGTIMQSKECILLASGATKADIIFDIYSSSLADEKIPATALYHHNKVTVLLDEQAASKLPLEMKQVKSPLVSRSIYAPTTSAEPNFASVKNSPNYFMVNYK